MSGDVFMSQLLVGMGVEDLSMSPVHILRIKEAIRKHSHVEPDEVACKVLAVATVGEVKGMLETGLA